MQPVVEGLRNTGWQVDIRESMQFPQGDEKTFDLLACWGDTNKAIDILQSRLSKYILHVDNSYLNRNRYEGHYALTWGGERQCHRYLWQSPKCPDRFTALNETILPWRTKGDKILLLAPSVKQGKILGFDTDTWARRMQQLLQKYTKRQVQTRIKRYNIDAPLRSVLKNENIFAAVGYNTKGLVECLLEGIPIFSLAPCAAQSMGLSDISQIETPFYPDNRQEFFERLSGTQFLLSEVAQGLPFADSFMETVPKRTDNR